MKKLILASVIALGSFTSFAAVPVISNNDFVETVYLDQDKYIPIDATELPDAITNALETDFPGVKISKAFKNEADEYKIQVLVGDKITNLYATKDGEWIQNK